MNRELLTKRRHGREAYGRWTQGQVTLSKRPGVALRKPKSYLLLDLVRDVKSSKKSFYRDMRSKDQKK